MSTKPRSSFLLLPTTLFVFTLLSASVVRSEPGDPSPLRFPVADEAEGGGDLCAAGTARPSSSSCPVKCFRADPVCGADGVTYWCGCPDAQCAGTRVVKLGFCEVGNGGSGSLSGQAFLLVHIVWLIMLGFSVLFGLL